MILVPQWLTVCTVFVQQCVEIVVAVDSCMDHLVTQSSSGIHMSDVQFLPQCAVVLIESSYTHCKVRGLYA